MIKLLKLNSLYELIFCAYRCFCLQVTFYITFCYFRAYTVLLGLHDVRNAKEIQRLSVKETFPHKDYDANELRNDIMLLKVI